MLKVSVPVTRIGYFFFKKKNGKVRILLLSVFPDFAFVNMKRNFNYETFKRSIDLCTILFPEGFEFWCCFLIDSHMLCFEMKSH